MATLKTYQLRTETAQPEFAASFQAGLEKASDFCKVQPAACKNNLGIPRAKMPQIQRAKTPEFLAELKAKGVKVTQGKARVGDLRATQREINAKKVAGMIEAKQAGKFDPAKAPVVVSNDQHILDGHHRWAALVVMDPSSKIPVRRVDLPMRELLRRAHSFKGVKYRTFEASAGWDIGQAAKTMKRFDFIAEFVWRMTKKKQNRDLTKGLEVLKTKQGWNYGFHGMEPSALPTRDTAKLYDMIRRTKLNYFVREAEDLRVQMATAQIDAMGPFKVGDEIFFGKYKNKRGRIISFGENHKNQITVEIEPIPKGRKQNKTLSLFKIWTIQTATIAELIRAGRPDLANALAYQAVALVVSPDNYIYTESGEYAWSPERAKAAWNKAYAKLRQVLKTGKYKKLVLMVGIPASGKSTWLKHNHEKDAAYFDATFTSRTARQPVIEIGQEAGVKIEAVITDTPVNVCVDRNKCRSSDRRVPDDVIERMATTLIGDLPTKQEGFDSIRVVKPRY